MNRGVLGLVVLLSLSTAPASAVTPTEVLRPAFEEVTRILENYPLDSATDAREQHARVRAVVSDLLDFPEMARRVLSRHWRSLSPAQHEEFTQLFRDFLEHTYLPKISFYKGERVRFTGESVDGDLATVQALIVTRQGKEIPVSYRLDLRDTRWRIFDISVEGISFISNYRAQFDQVIQRGSYQELVKRLKEKLAAPPDPTPPGLDRFLRGFR